MKKRPDGRYVKVITDPKTKKRISFYGKSAREVNQKILDYETKQESGRTFAEVAEIWQSESFPCLAHQTLKGYKPAYARAVAFFGNDYISDIEPHDVLAFYNTIVKMNFTQKTLSNHRTVLNQIFNRAIIDNDIKFNPCSPVKIPKGAKKSIPRKPASAKDEEIALASSHPWTFPLFALLTGLRKGEILALQWRDIDFDNNTISITKNLEHIGKRPNIKDTKTEAGERVVPLLDMLKERLEPAKGSPDAYIFSEDGGKSPLYEHRYTKLYNEYRKATGLEATAHQFRHSYATIAVEEEINPKDLQNALGHVDITTTMNIYTAVRKRSVEKVAEKLNHKYKK